MESKAKLFGHPIHPMLVVIPLGAFVGAVLFDALYFWQRSETLAAVGYWNIAVGVVGGLLAAVFGLVDFLAIPAGTRAKRIGLYHGITMAIVIVAFAAVWFARGRTIGMVPTPAIFTFEVAALVLGAVGAWLGGELVDRLGVGVDDGANLNAPSSLSGRTAGRV